MFCSDEVFEKRITRECENAAYEARVMDSVRRGVADIEEGRYIDSVGDTLALVVRMSDSYA